MSKIKDIVKLYQETGDDIYFNMLYERYSRPLHKYLWFQFRSQLTYDEIKDCTQEIFLLVVKNIDSYSTDYNFNTWLYTIGRNVCLLSIKDKMKLIKRTENIGFEINKDPDNQVDIDIKKLLDRIKWVNELDKNIFYDRLGGMSMKEISQKYNMNPCTVRSKIRTIRERYLKNTEEYERWRNG